jgi:hypothetical protein
MFFATWVDLLSVVGSLIVIGHRESERVLLVCTNVQYERIG